MILPNAICWNRCKFSENIQVRFVKEIIKIKKLEFHPSQPSDFIMGREG